MKWILTYPLVYSGGKLQVSM